MAALGGSAAWAWFGWIPSYRPELHVSERYGIDVSAHQGVIDWPKVASQVDLDVGRRLTP